MLFKKANPLEQFIDKDITENKSELEVAAAESVVKNVNEIEENENLEILKKARNIANKKEFNPEETTNGLKDSPDEAGRTSSGSVKGPALSNASKREFNPNDVANAMADSEKDGGILKQRTTGFGGGNDGRSFQPKSDLSVNEIQYELGGFRVEYEIPCKGEIITAEVKQMFDTLELATMPIKNNRYYMKLDDENIVECVIISGMPQISISDALKRQYINGKWERP